MSERVENEVDQNAVGDKVGLEVGCKALVIVGIGIPVVSGLSERH